MKCANLDCNYYKDGVCVDGLTEENCPNLVDFSQLELVSPDSIIESGSSDSSGTPQSTPEMSTLSFCGKTPLSIDETQIKIKDHIGKVISFIGPVGVGKTTLISSLYDIFSKKNEVPVTFGGSDTLYAFENLCHHARVTSRGSSVSTPRTSSLEGVRFYHLSIRDSQKTRQEFFLADRSGESYSEMVNNISLGSDFKELLRSDLLLFMVDSSLLGSKSTRHKTRRTTKKIIESLFESKILPKNTNCTLVLTKFDLVAGTEKATLCMSEAKRIVDEVQKGLDICIDILPLSARPNLEEHESPDCFKDLWQKLESLQRPKKKIQLNEFKTNRSFHNLELTYDN